MKVLVPVSYTDFVSLATSGVELSSHPAWTDTTTYAVGQQVYKDNYEYVALAPSTGVDPAVPAESPVWFRTGMINRLKVFDEIIYDQAVGSGTPNYIDYRIESPTTLTTVALFNVEGREVRVFLNDKATGTIVDDRTTNLLADDFVDNWSDYFFEQPNARNEALFDGLSAYPGIYLTVRVYAPGTEAKVGQIVVGRSYSMGSLNEDSQIGIQDYSRKERDDWGNPMIVERPFSQRAEYDLSILSAEVRKVQTILSRVRARAAVYFDDDDPTNTYGTTVFGYFQDFAVNLKVGEFSHMTLEVEGLV